MLCYQLYNPIHASRLRSYPEHIQQDQNVKMTATDCALSGRHSDGNGYIGGSLLIYIRLKVSVMLRNKHASWSSHASWRRGGENSPVLGE
ncbi:uncharacterized protein PgNI_03254 [Pyricularia grisea]|uniref:Uncharacterized protein n=1 Tax=Pyricularia grisea TaxID=148305 RepID=A0A6P8B996_PYRGI|nr:uncharacterized protein PgNI_03254 [Pyricularia grisea]TLD12222.1 hypothetical protein PgNI_03254 [Pyricularia grisea]